MIIQLQSITGRALSECKYSQMVIILHIFVLYLSAPLGGKYLTNLFTFADLS